MYALLVIFFQLFLYHFFLRSSIKTWGSSREEASMPMPGEAESQVIKSTRAISIHAKKRDVWKWLIQLGADRCGFYSYSFIEEALGYKTRHQDVVRPEFDELNPGDIVRGSIDEKSSIITYNFPVLDVREESTLILENWGTFFLQEQKGKTRLIIQTRENKPTSLWSILFSYIMVALHFIMERRTLMGLKKRVEAGEGVAFSQVSDMLWFFCVVLSEAIILFISFTGHNIQALILTGLASFIWLFVIFLFKPIPIYSVGLFFLCIAAFTLA